MAVHVGQGLQEGYWYWYCKFFFVERWSHYHMMSFVLCCFIFFQEERTLTFFQPKSDENFENFPPSNPFSNWGVYMTSCCAYTNWPRKQPPRFGTAKGSRCPLHGAWRLRFTTAADATFTRNSSRGTAKASRLERWWAADGGGVKNMGKHFFLRKQILSHGISHWYWYTSWWQLKYFWNFHPDRWGNDPILTNIFQMGRFNHQLDIVGKLPWYSWKITWYIIFLVLVNAWSQEGIQLERGWRGWGFGEICSQNSPRWRYSNVVPTWR